MSRIFISHSSRNDAQAIALKQWLVSMGWHRADDIFLDLDPETGIAPGQRWEKELEKAATRCEAVLFLISEAWLASKWCIDEFHLASKLNKRLFPLLLEPIERSRLPVGLTAHWQIGRLIPEGGPVEHLVAVHSRTAEQTPVRFSQVGLTTLRRGLEKAGISADSFKPQIYPTQPLSWRQPYRGLEALEEEDAAVFFGRDADIVRCIDKLRGIRELASSRLLVILGASGAGKSSFLRAGLLPRLKRDDSTWLPLKPIRVARGGVIDGAEGILVALEEAHRRMGLLKSSVDLQNQLHTAESFLALIEELRAAAARRAQSDVPPLPILAIDQAEELFLADAGPEAHQLLTLARDAMNANALLVLATIRSDTYGKLQDAEILAGVHQETLSLGPVFPGEIGRIIREPALRFRRELGQMVPIFHDSVVEKLQEELEGETDALPLLGFALQRLMREHVSGGTIDLAELARTGGVTKAIETAAEDAMLEAGIGQDASIRREALRAVFVPRLARVDAVSKTVQRRVARMGDAPIELQRMIKAFVNKRLLVTKGEGRDTTIEVAHEALLRRWPSLTALLEEDRDALLLLDGVLRAAREWESSSDDAKADLLVHRRTRLRDAQQLAMRGQDWAKEISVAQGYLAACAERDATDQEQLEVREKRILIQKQRLFAEAAGKMSAERRYDAAMRIALAGGNDLDSIKRGVDADPIRYSQLARAAHDCRLLRILEPHPQAVTCVAFGQDGKLLATSSHDGNARIFNCQTGVQIAALGPHAGWINGLAFSPDGNRLFTGGRDKTARVWQLSTGVELHRIEQMSDEVRCVAASRDLLAAGCSDGSISIWDSATYAPRSLLTGHGGAVLGLAFSTDGSRLVSGGDDTTVRVWNLDDQKPLWQKKQHLEAVNAVAFSPDGSRVASASYDHTARLWDARTGAEIRTLVGHSEPLRSISFSPEGARVATSGGDATARIWALDTGREILRLAGHTGWVHSVAFSREGDQVATGGFDGTVRLWHANVSAEIMHPSNLSDDLCSIAISAGGGLLAVGGAQSIRVYDLESGGEKPCLRKDNAGAKKVSFSPDNSSLLAATEDGVARIWDLHDGKERLCVESQGSRILAAAFDHVGALVATTTEDGAVRTWDSNTGAEIGKFPTHDIAALDVSFSPDGRLLATACRDGIVRICQTDTASVIQTIEAHSKPARRVAFSPDGTHLATAGEDWKARIWNVESGRKLGELASHGDQVLDVCFSRDGARLATASRDRTTRLWDAKGYVEIASFSSSEHAQAVVFHPGGIFVAMAGRKGLIRIWDTVFLAALSGDRLARAVAGYRLSGAERLTDEEVAELEKFTESLDETARNVADTVLRNRISSQESTQEDQDIKALVAIWRGHRKSAFELENRKKA